MNNKKTIPPPTSLGMLLEAHRDLIREGFEPLAQIIAQGLLDRVTVTTHGTGIVDPIKSGEALVLVQRVLDAAAPEHRVLLRCIMFRLPRVK